MIGMDKTLFLHKISTGDVKMANFLPVIVRRLFQFAQTSQELEDIVVKLVNLMVGLNVDAPPDFINKLITDLIHPLENYAQDLLKGDERMARAGGKLISATREIASKAVEGKLLAQMADGSPVIVDIFEA